MTPPASGLAAGARGPSSCPGAGVEDLRTVRRGNLVDTGGQIEVCGREPVPGVVGCNAESHVVPAQVDVGMVADETLHVRDVHDHRDATVVPDTERTGDLVPVPRPPRHPGQMRSDLLVRQRFLAHSQLLWVTGARTSVRSWPTGASCHGRIARSRAVSSLRMRAERVSAAIVATVRAISNAWSGWRAVAA